jgi:hypothetical protein
VYLPDLPKQAYQNLLEALEQEFTYTFGGATIIHGLDGSYLSQAGFPTRLGGFHAKRLRTGSESRWHQRLRDLCTRIPAGKEALGERE